MTDQESVYRPRSGGWGLVGLAAIVGLLAATVVVTRHARKGTSTWSVDDLINAADRAAGSLEHALNGETARAS